MKIIYCIPSLHISGGRERVVVNKANWLAEKGHDVTIITTDQGTNPSFYALDARIRVEDLAINYCHNKQRYIYQKIPYYFINKYKHIRRLKAFLDTSNADIIISTFANEMVCLSTYKGVGKKILELHTQKADVDQNIGNGILGRFRRLSIIRQIRSFDAFVVLTNKDRLAWGGAVAIPNALPFRPERRSSLTQKRALAVGRLCFVKNYERLICAWEIFHKTHSDWMLEIVGDGEMKEDLQHLIVSKDLSDSITLSPATSNIQQKYQESSVFLLTSRMESFGMVLIEAQSCGVPIISYDVPCGPAEIIHDGIDGFLVKDNDINAFVEKLSLLASNKELREQMGYAAYLNAQRYSEDRIMAQWEELFHKLKP